VATFLLPRLPPALHLVEQRMEVARIVLDAPTSSSILEAVLSLDGPVFLVGAIDVDLIVDAALACIRVLGLETFFFFFMESELDDLRRLLSHPLALRVLVVGDTLELGSLLPQPILVVTVATGPVLRAMLRLRAIPPLRLYQTHLCLMIHARVYLPFSVLLSLLPFVNQGSQAFVGVQPVRTDPRILTYTLIVVEHGAALVFPPD